MRILVSFPPYRIHKYYFKQYSLQSAKFHIMLTHLILSFFQVWCDMISLYIHGCHNNFMWYCQLFCLIVGRLECLKSYQKLWSTTFLPGLGRYLVMPLTLELSYPLYCWWCTYRILTQCLLYLRSDRFLSLWIITAWISKKCSTNCAVMRDLNNSWVFSLNIPNVHLQKGWYPFLFNGFLFCLVMLLKNVPATK